MPPLSADDYVELRCRSAFSFLEGASNPEDLADRAAELGHHTLALADRDGLYGAPRFHQAAKAAGLRGLVGAEVSLAEVTAIVKENTTDPDTPVVIRTHEKASHGLFVGVWDAAKRGGARALSFNTVN